MDVWTPHSQKQDEAIFSDKKIVLCCTGIQWGKTSVGARWLQRFVFQYTKKTDNFIVTAPNYKIMAQSTLPEFLKVFAPFGELKRVDMAFKISGGGTIYLRTETEPDSIVGITNVRAIWGDEAGKYRRYFWENMEARASFLNAPICLTTTPYALNWIFKEIIKPVQQGKRDDVHLVSASSIENKYFNQQSYHEKKKTMDPRRFKALYDGQFERLQGLVYPIIDDNIEIDNFIPITETKHYGGIDWGFTDPFVMQARAVTPMGFHCQVREIYKTGLTPDQIREIAKGLHAAYDFQTVFCDPSQPGMIKMLQQAGIPCVAANNDITVGIGAHYELISSGMFKILRGTGKHSIDEYEMYHYPEPKDLKPDEDSKEEKPVDQHNHAMDCARYISIATKDIHKKSSPTVPDEANKTRHETPAQYVRRIRKKSAEKKYEVWS